MKRKITEKLERWQEKESNMPFMLIGARQVGKTYILDEFCKRNFKDYIYINLEREKDGIKIFDLCNRIYTHIQPITRLSR